MYGDISLYRKDINKTTLGTIPVKKWDDPLIKNFSLKKKTKMKKNKKALISQMKISSWI